MDSLTKKTCTKCDYTGAHERFVAKTRICKKCMAEYQKKYRVKYDEKNKEKMKKYRKEYVSKNKNKRAAYAREWLKKNAKRESDKKKKYYRDNVEKISRRNALRLKEQVEALSDSYIIALLKKTGTEKPQQEEIEDKRKQIKYDRDNPGERSNQARKAYYQENKGEIIRKTQLLQKKHIKEISFSYVKKCLKKTGITEVTQEIVELKREQIKIHRALREAKNGIA